MASEQDRDAAVGGESTRAVHLPPPPHIEQTALAPPVHRSTVYAARSAQELSDLLTGATRGYVYGRTDNPTADAFAAGVAALEGAGAAVGGAGGDAQGQAFASGMAAATAILLAFTGAGAHVVAANRLYGGTYALLTDVLPRFGVHADLVDTTELAAVREALRPRTRLLWVETLANPTMRVADLPALAALAHAVGALLVVDSTFATPALCRPLEHGADLVMHSATKYIGGHNDATGGVVVGRAELVEAVRAIRIKTGGMLAADEAFLLRRGLATLPLRMARHCASALRFAEAMARHPRVARVDYPGLPSHPDHALAGKLFDADERGTRFGGVVTVTPHGGREAGLRLVDGLRLVGIATSLGGVHSKASHVASTSHLQLDDAALAAAGIGAASVRFSVGLEDPEDLVADVTRALELLP